jgi:hypothetical protein
LFHTKNQLSNEGAWEILIEIGEKNRYCSYLYLRADVVLLRASVEKECPKNNPSVKKPPQGLELKCWDLRLLFRSQRVITKVGG